MPVDTLTASPANLEFGYQRASVPDISEYAANVSQADKLPSKNTELTEDLVRQYLNEIDRYPLIDDAQEKELADLRDTGQAASELLMSNNNNVPDSIRPYLLDLETAGIEAKNDFVCSNLRLVVSIAKKFTVSGVELLDLIQVGNTELIRAVEGFDQNRKLKFSTIATLMISQAIQRYIIDKGRTISVSKEVAQDIYKMQKAYNALTLSEGREPTPGEVAEEMEVSEAKVRKMMVIAAMEPISFSEPIDDENTIADIIPDDITQRPEALIIAAEERQRLYASIGKLSLLEQFVISRLFGLTDMPVSYETVRKEVGLNRQEIREVEATALAKIREGYAGVPV